MSNIIKNCDELIMAPQGPSVVRNENDIYFYSDVFSESVLMLNLHIKDAVKLSRDIQLRYPTDNKMGVCVQLPVIIHINSFGGSVFDSLAAVDTIEGHIRQGVPIYTIIEGCAFSAATVIAAAGSKRFITKNSTYLIHEMSQQFEGKLSELEKATKGLKKSAEIYTRIYKQHSNMTTPQIKKLIDNEEYLSPEDVLKFGLVDEILC